MLVLGMASTASAVLVSSAQTYYFKMEISAPGTETDFFVGDTVTIQLFAGDTIPVTDMLNTVLNISEATSAAVATISRPGDWSVPPIPTTTADGGGGWNVNISGAPVMAGIPTNASIYSISFVANGAGVVIIDATSGSWSGYDAAVGPVDGLYDGETPAYEAYGLPYAEVTIIPEPMTIALLGLGGLFLLRRRK